MSSETHGPHPDLHVEGLQDGCRACTYAAMYPFAELDEVTLRNLLHRAASDTPEARSQNEGIALGVVRDALNRVGRLSKLDADAVAAWMARWGTAYYTLTEPSTPPSAGPETP